MLDFVILFCAIWILVCTVVYAKFCPRQRSLAVIIPLMLIATLLSVSLSSLPMLIVTLGTPVVVGICCWRAAAVGVRAFAALLSCLCLFGLLLGGLSVPAHLERVKLLQAKFPLEKLGDRLPPPSPFVLTSTPIEEFDRLPPGGEDRRAIGLKSLHGSMVNHFSDAPGFGMNRMGQLRVFYFSKQPLPDRPVIPLEPSPGRYQIFEGLTEARLKQYHEQGVQDFVNPAGFGWVKDHQAVAGFQEHQISQRPVALWDRSVDSPRDQWNIVQFQLVSLLKHDPPMVYESTHLPRMDELNQADVRPLTPFEEQGLSSLHSGKSPMMFASRDNKTVRMLGAIRARRDCRDCHQVPEGALLGAFSYELLEVKSNEYVPAGTEVK